MPRAAWRSSACCPSSATWASNSTGMRLDGHRVPAAAVLGGEDGVGRGFQQMMSGVEVGRINVAARAIGTARRAYELAIAYALRARGVRPAASPSYRRSSSSSPTWRRASRPRACSPCRPRARRTRAQRADVETGMAKLFASEMCQEVVLDAMRIHGGIRLLQGVRDRAPLPRRADAAARRGHERDPEDDRRARADAALAGGARWDVRSTRARRASAATTTTSRSATSTTTGRARRSPRPTTTSSA